MMVPRIGFSILLVSFVLSNALGETFETCNHTINLVIGKTEQFKSPNWPQQDPPGTSCVWNVVSPENTLIFLSCPNAVRPKEQPCGGFFNVYQDSIQSINKRMFCRGKPFYEYSVSNKMFITYDTNHEQTHGGWPFECNLFIQDPSHQTIGVGECNCGKTNTARVRGGEATGANQYPMMVTVWVDIFGKRGSGDYCGGTIISAKHVLTAAHCVWKQNVGLVSVISEMHDRLKHNEHKFNKVKEVFFHPRYNGPGTYVNNYDIAILELIDPMALNEKALPACLPFANKENTFVGQDVTALGWGMSANGTFPDPPVLHKLDGFVLDEPACKNLSVFRKADYSMEFCTFKTETALCMGDSGGPILWLDPVTFQQKVIGVFAFGGECGPRDSPGLSIRVTAVLDWIEEKTQGTAFCKR